MSPAAPATPTAKQGDPNRAGSPATEQAGSTKGGTRKRATAACTKSEWPAELEELGKAFRGVFRSLNRLRGRDTHLGGSELSHAQFELLIELYERGPLPAGELAAAAGLTPATVTQMLDHLADCGHVERARSQSDRRVVVSRLTTQGRRKIEAKRAAWRARWRAALAGVDPEELRAATRVLERLRPAFEDAALPEPPATPCSPAAPQMPATVVTGAGGNGRRNRRTGLPKTASH
jgi:DNA-binding MarR family transcriptional regulator